MPRMSSKTLAVGVADHAGWAILVTVNRDGVALDRRRVELVEEGLPVMPHHHEGQKLPLAEAVELVARVQASAERHAKARLDELVDSVGTGIAAIALRACPALPESTRERLESYRAMCVADWVMYRQALARAAANRGWSVRWYDARLVSAEAARALPRGSLTEVLEAGRAALGSPWTRDHKVAMAAAIAAARGA